MELLSRVISIDLFMLRLPLANTKIQSTKLPCDPDLCPLLLLQEDVNLRALHVVDDEVFGDHSLQNLLLRD